MRDSEMLTVNQAAMRLNVSVKTIRNLIASGKLVHYRVGAGRGVIRIREAALDQHLAECEVRGSGSPAPQRRRERRKLRHIKL